MIGTYADKTAMINKFGNTELVQATTLDIQPDVAEVDVIVDTVLQAAIDQANSVVDGYVRSKYTLPLVEVPPSLVSAACDIARHTLWKNRASERVLEGYNNAIAFLKDISRGLVSLGPTVTQEAPTVSVGAVSAVNPTDAVMTSDTLQDYRSGWLW